MTKRRRLAHPLQFLAAGAAALHVAAPHAQSLPAADDPGAVQRVVVTGSSIGRISGETPDEVQVITADDMRRAGRTSVREVLQSLTANGQGTLSQSFPGSVASGAAGVALRGLTVGSTLVLIDGHRMAPFPIGDDGQRSFVDIANLPFEAVDRIEVLKSGGSAAYGSDAIAGVVNIILKPSFNGGRLSAELGTSQHGGGTLRHVSGLFGGGDLDADGRNVYVTGEFSQQDAIRLDQRGGRFTRTDYRASGGDDIASGAHNVLVGDHPDSGTGYVTTPDGTIAGFMNGCDATRFAADECTYRDTWHVVLPPTRHANLTGRLTQALGQDWRLVLDASYFDSRSAQFLQPASTFTGGDQGVVFGPGQSPTLLPALGPTTIPSTNPSFPAGTGLSVANLYYTFLDLGPKVTRSDARTTRLAADLSGHAGAWRLDASAGYSQVALDLVSLNFVSSANLQTALDSTTDPYIVGGPNAAAVDAFIAPRLSSSSTSRLGFVHVEGTRDVAALPGGAWSVALGADQVMRTQHAVSAPESASGLVTTASNAYAIGVQDISSIRAESRAPLSRSLEVDAAVRYDHYNLSGGRASPSLGFRYAPPGVVSFHGTASRGFRAPGPAENGNAGQAYTAGTFADPVLCADGNPSTPGNFPSQCVLPVPGLQATNRHLRPETSRNYTLGLAFQPLRGLGAKLDLYSIEIDHQIVVGPGVVVRGTNLSPIDQVQADGSTALVVPSVAPIAYVATPYINANRTTTSGLDFELEARRRIGGLGDVSSRLVVSYASRYDTTIAGTTYHLAGTHGPSYVSGDTGNPRTRMQWATTLSTDAWDVTATLDFVGSYGVTDPSAVAVYGVDESTCLGALANSGGRASEAYATALGNGQVPAGVSCRVRSFTSVDLAARVSVTRHLSVHGAVANLFDAAAPYDWATYGGSGAPFNPALHLSGAVGRYFTAGATYTF